MNATNLGKIEKKLLGAMLIHADSEMFIPVTRLQLAKTMGYKTTGGAISFALQSLEHKNFVTSFEGKLKVLL